jgi:hypothetical protein
LNCFLLALQVQDLILLLLVVHELSCDLPGCFQTEKEPGIHRILRPLADASAPNIVLMLFKLRYVNSNDILLSVCARNLGKVTPDTGHHGDQLLLLAVTAAT